MRLRLKLAAAVAVALLAALPAHAQFAYYSPYQTNAAGDSAGQVFGTGDFLYHPAVRVGGTVARVPEPADTSSGFAYTISPNSQWAAGMITTNGARQSARWRFANGAWTVHSTAPTPAGVFFAYPVQIADDGTATVSGINTNGTWHYSTWPATAAVAATALGAVPAGLTGPPPPPPAELTRPAVAAADPQPVTPAATAPLWASPTPWSTAGQACVGGQCSPSFAPASAAARRTGPVRRLLGW